ncbi:MAG: adenylate/guanylate cyclase domain-containing protein [Nitrospirae bacterium]|nr:adenylate/guanylate cyclase domain-containing protein [Nitrospirota bacterium]
MKSLKIINEKVKTILLLAGVFLFIIFIITQKLMRFDDYTFWFYDKALSLREEYKSSKNVVLVDVQVKDVQSKDDIVKFRKNVGLFLNTIATSNANPKVVGLDISFEKLDSSSPNEMDNATSTLINAASYLKDIEHIPLVAGWKNDFNIRYDPKVMDVIPSGHTMIELDNKFIYVLIPMDDERTKSKKESESDEITHNMKPFFGLLIANNGGFDSVDGIAAFDRKYHGKIPFSYNQVFDIAVYGFDGNELFRLTRTASGNYERQSIEKVNVAEAFSQKVVIAGSMERDIMKNDIHGLHVMGQAVSVIINKQYPEYEDRTAVIWVVFLAGIFAELLIFRLIDAPKGNESKTTRGIVKAFVVSSIITCAGLLGIVYGILRLNYLFLDMPEALLMIVTAGVCYGYYQYKHERGAYAEIKEAKSRLVDSIKKYKKKVTIMYTDLKGSSKYTAASGDDAALLIVTPIIDIIKKTVKEKKGKFVKDMGDGTLSYFEAGVKDALEAAFAIQAEVKNYHETLTNDADRIPVRIGLHSGLTIVDAKDLFGDTANIASRYEPLAEPGGVCISEAVFNELDEAGKNNYGWKVTEATLKGRSEPQKIYKSDVV